MATRHHAESAVLQPKAEQLPVRPDVLVSEAAARNWSVLDVEELKACGLSGDGIWVRTHNGHLHQMHRGVYAVGHAKVPLEGCFLAAVKACRPDAWLSGVSAGSKRTTSCMKVFSRTTSWCATSTASGTCRQ